MVILVIIAIVIVAMIILSIVQEMTKRRQSGDDWGEIISDFSSDMVGFVTRPKYGSGSFGGEGTLQLPGGDDPFLPQRRAKKLMGDLFGDGPVYLPVPVALEKIKEVDPAFSEDRFLAVVNLAFPAIQAAWSARDLSGAQMYLSRHVAKRYTDQLAGLRQRKLINRLEKVKIRRVTSVLVEPDRQGFQAITVRIDFSLVDYTIEEGSGRMVSGSKAVDTAAEFWTFGRRCAKTPKQGLAEGQCPNCGAGLQLNAVGRCEYCDSDIQSGNFDWVLLEITQTTEWTQPRFSIKAIWKELPPMLPGAIPGMAVGDDAAARVDQSAIEAQLLAADPGFSRADLEDYAGSLFFRLCRAVEEGKPELVGGLLAPAPKAALAARFAADKKQGQRQLFDFLAVGSVELEQHWQEGDYDLLGVRITASGAPRRIKIGADPGVGSEADIRPFTENLVLHRRKGAKTVRDQGLFSEKCPGCGHPLDVNDQGACTSCGLDIGKADKDWVLVEAATMLPAARHIPGATSAPGQIGVDPS